MAMSNLSGNWRTRHLDRISTKRQISLLLAMLFAGVSLMTVVAMTADNLIRGEILRLSNETSPTQVRLAKFQSGSGSLSAEMRVFVDRFAGSFGGSDGSLAARAAMLARSNDNEARTHYESLERDLTQTIDALSDRIAGEIDPLDLTIIQINAGMDQAIDLSARVGSVSTTVAQISDRTSYIQVLAWRFLAEPDSAGVDRTVREVSDETAEVDQGLLTLTKDLSGIETRFPPVVAEFGPSRIHPRASTSHRSERRCRCCQALHSKTTGSRGLVENRT
jgi:hypothetical protein